jgi:hypothetical protein
MPPSEIEFLLARLGKLKLLAALLEAQSRRRAESLEHFEMLAREIQTIRERLQMLRQHPSSRSSEQSADDTP